MAKSRNDEGFDMGSAVTRSLLGWGVVAGIFYLTVGIAQALLREAFSLTEHPLSLLMLGDLGWIQVANLILTGLMVLAAAAGFQRALKPDTRATRTGVALGIYGLALILSGIFPPDTVDGFPEATSTAEATTRGVLHLASGCIGFVALATAAFYIVGWYRARGQDAQAGRARLAGLVILIGFLGGAATATSSIGVGLLWVAVVTGWIWLAATSVAVYRVVPHPDLHVRQARASQQ